MVLTKVLRKLSAELTQTEIGMQDLNAYREMQKHRGWKVYQGLVVTVANAMAQYLLSKEFSELDPSAKDREQWAIYMGKEVMDFLLDPTKHAEVVKRFALHNMAMEATLKRGVTGKGKSK